jgi:LPXTG-motif cell wall-anchored protein
VEAESQSGNRLFVILAVALIGLICIGLMGLGGVLFLINNGRAQDDIALQVTETPTPFPPTFTPTSTPTFTPTNTPEPTPTGTQVVQMTGGETDTGLPAATTDPNATATNTPIIGSLTPAGTADITTPTPAVVPGSGGVLPATSNSVLLWLGSGLLILLVFGSVFQRRRRTK